MPDFSSIEALLNFMRQQGNSDLPVLASTLDRWIEEEAEVLLGIELDNTKGAKRSASKLKACRQDAEYHYLSEIREFYAEPQPLHHYAVMFYRRKAKAWAVAAALRTWSLNANPAEATGT